MGRVWMTGSMGSTLDPDDFTATIEDVKETKKAGIKGYTEAVYGIMKENPPENKTLSPGETYKVPKGFHTGTEVISVSNFEDLTSGTATAEDIAMDKTAHVNGIELVGTIPVVESEDITLNTGSIYYIPKGIHDGNGIIRTNEETIQTTGTATSSDILIDKTAWVNGIKIMGSMNSIPALDHASSIYADDTSIYLNISNGAHITPAEDGNVKAVASIDDVLIELNLTADVLQRGLQVGSMTGELDYVERDKISIYSYTAVRVDSNLDLYNIDYVTRYLSLNNFDISRISFNFDFTNYVYNTLQIKGYCSDAKASDVEGESGLLKVGKLFAHYINENDENVKLNNDPTIISIDEYFVIEFDISSINTNLQKFMIEISSMVGEIYEINMVNKPIK